jgi:cytochrome c biogenesis protein CcmG, thiol:disulfide interchange protein DsbE
MSPAHSLVSFGSRLTHGGALAAAVLAVSVTGCDAGAGPGAASPGGKHPLIDNPAPAFDLPAQSGGKRASLEKAQGKVVLVDFWATWCGPCRASFPKYEAIAKKFEDDVVVIGISEDDEADGIADFAKETGATFTLAWDSQKSVAGSYKPDSMPTSFIVDKNGLVRFVHSGFRAGEEKEIEAQVKSLIE